MLEAHREEAVQGEALPPEGHRQRSAHPAAVTVSSGQCGFIGLPREPRFGVRSFVCLFVCFCEV